MRKTSGGITSVVVTCQRGVTTSRPVTGSGGIDVGVMRGGSESQEGIVPGRQVGDSLAERGTSINGWNIKKTPKTANKHGRERADYITAIELSCVSLALRQYVTNDRQTQTGKLCARCRKQISDVTK